MVRKGYRSGVALITALVLTGVSTLVIGSVVGYVSYASRMTGYYEGKNICRLAAQSEIELAKSAINYHFELSLNRTARIIGADSIGQSTSSYDWFEAYSGTSAKRTIGPADKRPITLAEVVTNNGCLVKVRIGRVEHTVGDQWANVTLVAEATRPGRGGATARSVIEETVRFAQQRSKVFNNAYFVNNFGWFSGGSSIKIDGDVRSNGNFQMDPNITINGHVYAAKNTTLANATGSIYNGTGKMDSKTDYKKASYGTANRMRPLETDPVSGAFNKGGYDAPDNPTTDDYEKRLHPGQELSVEMPYIGDISSNESEYRAWAQELHDADPNMATIKKGGKTLVSVYYDGVGPSGEATFYDASGNQVQAPDYGAIELCGTSSDPIVINGPVIIPNDVIISGYVKGQGTIYSGRNIHIVGNITYKNPPSWSQKSTSGSNNQNADMLGLMAKGNIVIGNYNATYGGTKWTSKVDSYLYKTTYVPAYDCDTSDAAIGYPKRFNDSSYTTYVNYKSEEKVNAADFAECQNAGLADFVPGGRNASTGKFGKNRGQTVNVKVGSHTERQRVSEGYYKQTFFGKKWVETGYHYDDVEVDDYAYRPQVSYDRKYYETVCNDSVITKYGSTGITQIDAVMYDNHGIFGVVGGCSFNGSIVCRTEGICGTGGGLFMNWDIRLYSGSSETIDNDKIGLAKASDNPPEVIDWRELPEGVITID